ncbi:uncharacterized protein LOC110866148 [Helianthus annuus]|uniref:uncharacterized protein LOC110866148 n=1 Tax=Helianthus annuus TaxID=4232 RepID=UPI000B8F27E2|nr:uncharacterized protein LOC110866148 [Helianthus annuus]
MLSFFNPPPIQASIPQFTALNPSILCPLITALNMSSSSSSVLRFKGKTQHSDIICSCGAKTAVKQSESTVNPGRWYIRCVGGCGFLRWADKGEEQGCPVCRKLACNSVGKDVENEKDVGKDEDVVAAEEPDSYVYFEDQESEILRPYMEQETDYEKISRDLTKDYDPEVLEHAWDYTYWDEDDDWYFDPYEGEHGSDSD